MMLYYFLMYIAVFFAAAGQVMLKKGSGAKGFKFGVIKLNIWVILGLMTMVFSMLFSVRGLRVVPLVDLAFILPTIYILVPLFSMIFLKERLAKNTIVGTIVLVVGIVLFNIPIIKLS